MRVFLIHALHDYNFQARYVSRRDLLVECMCNVVDAVHCCAMTVQYLFVLLKSMRSFVRVIKATLSTREMNVNRS